METVPRIEPYTYHPTGHLYVDRAGGEKCFVRWFKKWQFFNG